MGWGGGWGNRVPETARTVARAFYAGKSCKRGNCETDGAVYILEQSIIASRIKDDLIPDMVAAAIAGQHVPKMLQFTFRGWPTEMTCRHLQALGVRATLGKEHTWGPRGGIGEWTTFPMMNGSRVNCDAWYTPEQIERLPRWVQPPYVGLVAHVNQHELAFA